MKASERIEELYQEIQNGRFSEPEETYKLCSELYSIGENQNDDYVKSYALLYMADVDITIGDLNKALLLTKDVIKRAITYHQYDLLMKAYNLVAVIFNIEHDDVMSLTYYLKGLSIAENQNDNLMKSLFYSNIGSIFSNYDSEYGQQYLVRSLHLSDEFNITKEYGDMDETTQYNREVQITNIAISYVYSKNYGKALDLLHQHFGRSQCKIPVFAKIPYFFVLVKSYHNLNQLEQARAACRKAACFTISELNSTEDFLLYIQIIKEYMELISYPEGKLLLDRLQAEEQSKGNAINQATLFSLYIDYYKHEEITDKLFDSYRSYYKYYKQGQEMLRRNYIDALEKSFALSQEEEISNHYKQDEAELEVLSQIDAMTSIPNRYGLNHYYKKYFESSRDLKQNFGIMIIDIDYFKSYNDTMGHIAGDECIRQVAKIISSSVGSDFLAARFGGDEFFVACHNVSMANFEKQAALLVENVAKANIPFDAYPPLKHVSISLGGVNMVPESFSTVQDFIRTADSSLYQAKETSRNTYQIATHLIS